MTSQVTYHGNLRTEAVHLKSGQTIINDAPTDNNGKGEAFSPTDMVATALATCMITIMGIKAASLKIDIEGTKADITKIMASNPRRIEKVEIALHMPTGDYTEKDKKILEAAARACPVAQSVHPDLIQSVSFKWL